MDRLLAQLAPNVQVTPSCWLWTGALQGGPRGGHPLLTIGNRRCRVHRLVYAAMIGRAGSPAPALPRGYDLAHLCGVRRCVRPAHLVALPHGLHLALDAMMRTHCRRGHPLTPANLILRRVGPGRWSRTCRTCRNASSAAWRRQARQRQGSRGQDWRGGIRARR